MFIKFICTAQNDVLRQMCLYCMPWVSRNLVTLVSLLSESSALAHHRTSTYETADLLLAAVFEGLERLNCC